MRFFHQPGAAITWDHDDLASALQPDWEMLDRHHWRQDLQARYGANLDEDALDRHAELASAVLGEHPETIQRRQPNRAGPSGVAESQNLVIAQAFVPFFARPPVGPPPPGVAPKFKQPKPRIGGKEGSKRFPSWARGRRPMEDENGDQFARRLMDEQYGKDNWASKRHEFQWLKKFGDRSFGELPLDWEDDDDEEELFA